MIAGGRSRTSVLALAGTIVLAQVVLLLGIHVLSVVLGQEGFYPIVLGGDDGRFHYAVARYMLATNQIGANFTFFDVTIWPSVLAEFMKLTGSDSILLLKVLLLTGRLLAIAAAMIALEALRKGSPLRESPQAIVWSRVALLLLVGLYPSAIFYSFGSLYRDALIYGLYFLTIAFLVQAVADSRIGVRLIFLLLSVPCAYALFEFRAYAAYSVALAGFLWLAGHGLRRLSILASPKGYTRSRLVWLVMFLFLISAGSAAWYTAPIQQLVAFRDSYFFTPSGSNLGISFTGLSPLRAAPLYLYSWISNAIGPLVWQVHNAANLLDFALEIPLLAYIAYGIWRRRQALTPACSFLIVQAVVWFSMIAFTNDNLGTASRLRVLGWQCLFVVFAYLAPRARKAANWGGMRAPRPTLAEPPRTVTA